MKTEMKSKFFFRNANSEQCYTKQHFIDRMKEVGLSHMFLLTAERSVGEGLFWCTENLVAGQVGDGECGKTCEAYEPRNGKNGRCQYSGHCYNHGELIKLNINGRIES